METDKEVAVFVDLYTYCIQTYRQWMSCYHDVFAGLPVGGEVTELLDCLVEGSSAVVGWFDGTTPSVGSCVVVLSSITASVVTSVSVVSTTIVLDVVFIIPISCVFEFASGCVEFDSVWVSLPVCELVSSVDGNVDELSIVLVSSWTVVENVVVVVNSFELKRKPKITFECPMILWNIVNQTLTDRWILWQGWSLRCRADCFS